MCTTGIQYVYYMYTVCVLQVYSMCTTCVLHVYSMCTTCSLEVPSLLEELLAPDVSFRTRGVLLREKQAAMNALSLKDDLEMVSDKRTAHSTMRAITPALPTRDMNSTCVV